jgi:hypothetical protein
MKQTSFIILKPIVINLPFFFQLQHKIYNFAYILIALNLRIKFAEWFEVN